MPTARRLILAHFWLAFVAFLLAAGLGVWQMWVRSPLSAPLDTPGRYYQSVTAHGVSMAYVLSTFFIMGFGYYVAETALRRPLPSRTWAWAGFWLGFGGVILTVAAIAAGQASVLYTFYPPLMATIWFYVGLVLVVVGSWIWCVLMIVAMAAFKRATNVNTMVVPGYVSQVHTVFRTTGDLLMPCHEYCGLGHSQMTATVRVVAPQEFRPGPDGRVSCADR